MTAMILRRFTLFVVLFVSIATASIQVLNNTELSEDEIQTLPRMTGIYVSVNDLARILSTHIYKNEERKKVVLYIGDHRIKISAESGYVIIDGEAFQMPVHAVGSAGDIYLPAEAFFTILRTTTLPGITYDSHKQTLEINITKFNINRLTIDEKANGTILRLRTGKYFNDGDISIFKHQNGWFYITINGGLVDAAELNRTETRGVIQQVTSDQMKESVQLAFKLRSDIEGYEFYQSHDPSEIVVTLRSPLSKSAARIKNVRNRWRMDTIVLDAGHGGKDGGTVGKYGTKEKDITLDITKRVGRLIEKKTHTKVVYTRDEDVFIPLWKRTKIANENNGKLFVSIHVNANPNRNIKGYETYLLRPGKTEDAIEVSSRENSVINLENTGKKKYESLKGENLIMATMAQAMFMKESEDLASAIQSELSKKITSKNRGVKQAGFYVLIGASMPNVLVEVGFLSNPSEEKKLKKSSYRQRIAEGIYTAILKFKKSREKVLAEG
ncbi:MAG: N-acetylmuramoyl-L-alanine amidase [Candidatus Marinimicrobia bacterium]|nr:N-acetylmuramoyl-L-alanine amidase [Candidatus Neomarinimicrobiota bacterium]